MLDQIFENGVAGTCMVCWEPLECYHPPGDRFWSHYRHPEDGHDAVPDVDWMLERLRKAELDNTTAVEDRT